MITIFIDLLGFSNNLKESTSDSFSQIKDFRDMFYNVISRKGINCFHAFVPFSDFVILQVEDNVDFLESLSEILYTTFMLNKNSYTVDTIKNKNLVPIQVFSESGNTETKYHHWFPNIYRGGMSLLKAETITSKGFIGTDEISSTSILGPGIVEAHGYEKKTKGPRILLNKNLYDKVKISNPYTSKYFLQKTEIDDLYELNWTIFPIYELYLNKDLNNEHQLNDLFLNDYRELRVCVNNFEIAHKDNPELSQHYECFGNLVENGLKHFLNVKNVRQELINQSFKFFSRNITVINYPELKLLHTLRHKSSRLNNLFYGYQGQKLENSKYIFWGQDANFKEDFDNLPTETLEAFDLYFNDLDKFITKHNIHSPLLLNEYCKSKGFTYHETFQKICNKVVCLSQNKMNGAEIYKSTCFLEILNFPTITAGSTSADVYKIFLEIDDIAKHVTESFKLQLAINHPVKIFITPFVIELIHKILEQAGIDKNLIKWLKDSKNIWKSYKFNSNITFCKIYHFSYRTSTVYNDEGITKVANLILE